MTTSPDFSDVAEQLRSVRTRKQALGDDIRKLADRTNLSTDGELRFERKLDTLKQLEEEELRLERAAIEASRSMTATPGDARSVDDSNGGVQHLRRVD